MKKSLLIIAAVAMSFVACSKEEIQTVSKGMTLSANVADDNTKATITDKGDKSWSFAWEIGDVVSVTSPSGAYNFIYDGKSFKNAEAEPAKGDWTAYFPANEALNIVKQDGTQEWVANHYFVTGTKNVQEDGVSKLDITMTPKVAVLHLTNTGTSANEYKICLCTGTSSAASKTFITGINTDGSFITSSSDANYIGIIEKDEDMYFIVPAGYIRLCRYTISPSSVKMGNARTVEAGKVYNLNISNMSF